MPGDRDKRRPHTPAMGVREQLAPAPEVWEGEHSPGHLTPVNEQTINESIVERIDRRVGDTKNSTIDVLGKIDKLREDTQAEVKGLHTKVDGVITTVGNMRVDVTKQVGDVATKLGFQQGQNEQIIKMLQVQATTRDRAEYVDTTERVAEVQVHTHRQLSEAEVTKATQLATIEDANHARMERRKRVTKIIGAATGAGTLGAVIHWIIGMI